ncbi:MAG: hypothetical protein CMI94_01370 [Pelagibacteraceae bacterium]|nr:hypothetical protein [Pelagibacteraceae bacterium]|tara:strand:+ start:1781 stop:2542 length:762 start_codon:yes stop_codon:yes gene_type:complete
MKKYLYLTASFIISSNIAYAADAITRESIEKATGVSIGYNTSWSSHYVWRGESQSSKDMSPAIGVDLGHSSGFYLGAWTGSITNGTHGAEFDVYAGYAFDLGPLSFDIGDLYYLYPGESNEVQFNEYYFSVGTEIPLSMVADDFSVSPYVYLAYAPKWFGANTPDALYTEAGIEAPIPGTNFSVAYTYGNIDIDDLEGDGEKGADVDSWDYYYITVGFGELLGLDTSVTYHNAPGYSADAGQDGFFVSLGHEW